MQIFNEDGQACLFTPDGFAGKMYRAHSAAARRNTRTSGSYWRRSLGLKTIPFMSLDLTPGHGNLLGESYWELISPWLGGSSMLNTGLAPLSEEDVYTLSQILEDSPHRRYYLSRIACLGILRRARERGKELPAQLKAALTAQAACRNTEPNAFAADEVRALHNRVGILGAQPIEDPTQTQQSGSCGERGCSKMSELSHLCGSEGYEVAATKSGRPLSPVFPQEPEPVREVSDILNEYRLH